jgi:predicted small secreted protein
MLPIKNWVSKKNVVFILFPLFLSACNTFSGMGKDITNSAEWTKGKITGQDTNSDKDKASSSSQSK